MNHNIGLILQKRAFLTPDLEGVHDVASGQRLTYSQLDQRANKIANAYLSLGVQKGDRVGLLLMNSIEFVETIFALAKIGAVAVPLNWRLVESELSFIINDCGVSLFVFDTEFFELASSLQQSGQTTVQQWLQVCSLPSVTESSLINTAIEYQALRDSMSDTPPSIDAYDDDNLFIMYTSGTTGLPKGVVHTHDTAMWSTITSSATIETRFGDHALMILPLFHIGALNPLLTCVKAGACISIARSFDPLKTWQIISEEKINTMLAVPAMLNFMLQVYPKGNFDHSGLRYCLVGAAPVPESLIQAYRQMGIALIQVYGLTESCGPGCVLDELSALEKIGSTGKAYFHTDVKIAKANGEEAAANETGEILIKGQHIMKEYWNNPEATAKTIRDGWLYTGDVGAMDEQGFVTIKDRIKDMIISGGENIYPAEVENALTSHADILEAAVVGRPHPKWGESPVAFVVRKAESGEDIDEGTVIQFCKSKLASYKCPQDVVFIDALPRNPSGKILKRVLREEYIENAVFGDEEALDPA